MITPCSILKHTVGHSHELTRKQSAPYKRSVRRLSGCKVRRQCLTREGDLPDLGICDVRQSLRGLVLLFPGYDALLYRGALILKGIHLAQHRGTGLESEGRIRQPAAALIKLRNLCARADLPIEQVSK